MSLRRKATRAALAVAVAAFAGAAAPAVSHATVEPSWCTQTQQFDPRIPTWEQWFAAHPDPDAVLPLGYGQAGAGGGAPRLGSGTPPVGRNLSKVLYEYFDGLVATTADDTSIPYKIIKKYIGTSSLGREISFYVAGTRENIDRLDGPDGDAAFWRGVRSGEIATDVGLDAAGTRPAFAWITATPHGDESAAGESITREAYELLARTDCENWRRMSSLDLFLQPIRNPDGHDVVTRTTAWAFDPNRDFGTQTQPENALFVPEMNQYPGVFFIDAHQQSTGYFFPPNEDPVHHEISHFSLDFIQNQIGPALQRAFNDQSSQYNNYNRYDLFTPEYGDTVPSLIMGAAGMTYEKGNREVYGKQVYDHYLAIDTTVNLTASNKVKILSDWVSQWGEAVQQGANCKLQDNTLVSPLHDTIANEPDTPVCGYFFKPGAHEGDVAALINLLQKTGVRVYSLDTNVNVFGLHEFGKATTGTGVVSTLPKGTLYIPMAQGMKHWIQALLGENPYIAYNYYYDVVTWSYPLQRGLAGSSGFLTQNLPAGVTMTEIHGASLGSAPAGAAAVYAFNTDSMRGLGLVADLLAKGVNVYRGGDAFDAGGRHFYTGAALVDGASLAGKADIAALAAARNTPVSGLSSFPVVHYQMGMPKLGLYTGSASIPNNPLYPSGTNVSGSGGHCATASGGTSFCAALFTLRVKDQIPADMVVPVTSADVLAGKLVSDHYTAFLNPNGNLPVTTGNPPTITPTGQALKDYIAQGGVYIGNAANGFNAASGIGATGVSTETIAGILTPGSTFDATIDTSDPVAWGFDLGGWIYRESNGDPVWKASSLGTAKAVASYAPSVATNPGKYGYQTNAAGLAGRPAVIDAPYMNGRSILLGFDPFYRAWRDQDERFVLNAMLYPAGPALDATAPSPETAGPAPLASALTTRGKPLSRKALAQGVRKVASRPDTTRDLRIRVKRADAAKLKAAVKAAKLSKALRRKVRYATTRTTVTLVMKGVRTSDEHARKAWVSRITAGLDKRQVDPIYALV